MGVVPRIDNLCGFAPTATLSLNSMLPFGQPAHDPEGGRKKRVPESIIELLTARSLAYWFMDDGASTSKKSRSRTYRFSTHSFHPNPVRVSFSAYPLDDQKRLVEALKDNLDIAATIQKERCGEVWLIIIIYSAFGGVQNLRTVLPI